MIEVVVADIAELSVDAIVNAANPSLLGGGGVDGAIHRAAGPGLLAECRALPEAFPGVRCPIGEARLTGGHRLPARYVLHTVGPIWRGGAHDEPHLLARAYRSCLDLAAHYGLHSVAFPAISCGAYGYPVDAAARIAVAEACAWLAQHALPEQIILCAHDPQMPEHFRRALQDVPPG